MSTILSSIANLLAPKKKPIIFEDYESIAELGKKTNRILITIEDNVYDVTDFKDHPGGYKVLELCRGKDATDVFKKYHWPEGKSRKLMKKYKIGELDLLKGFAKKDKKTSK
mgnify:FL=1